MKFPKKLLGNHGARKVRNSISQGRPARIDMKSPSRSLESSHVMNYNYESDTKSVGGKNLELSPTFPKLKWPESIGDVHEDEGHGNNRDNKDIHDKKKT